MCYFVVEIAGGQAQAALPITLAENSKAALPIVISSQANPATRAVATELAEYLGRIANTEFQVKTSDGSDGIGIPPIKRTLS